MGRWQSMPWQIPCGASCLPHCWPSSFLFCAVPVAVGACVHSARTAHAQRAHDRKKLGFFLLTLAIFLPVQTILHPHNVG